MKRPPLRGSQERRPRALSKGEAHLDRWCNAVAPSDELRRWYGHDPRRFEEFSQRYLAELQTSEAADALKHLQGLADHGPLTLLTATKEPGISEAAVLCALIAGDLQP
ncbi:DUF488 domain-containing protein [Arthrobacter sp. FW306-07-I]|uniref:DUF488 domain-containing protein n=1 Tax=Arthrobacter sp. FW306-07-I TaxID=2879622 RepID=UPI003FA494A9|nr:DUF488 family protein [Arthrobacter sp. FW306-07-I]